MVKKLFLVVYLCFFLVLCYYTGEGIRESSKIKYANLMIDDAVYEMVIKDVVNNNRVYPEKSKYVGLSKATLKYVDSDQINRLFDNINGDHPLVTNETLETFLDKGLGTKQSIFDGIFIEFGKVDLPNKDTLEIETKVYKTENQYSIMTYRLELIEEHWSIKEHVSMESENWRKL